MSGEAQTSTFESAAGTREPEPSRRDLLTLITVAGASLFGVAVTWALVDSMNPAADVIAAGAPIDIDLQKVAPGQQIIVLWRGSPIAIVNRSAELLKVLQSPALLQRLSDPDSTVHQQPPYAQNWHRSIKPEYLVLVAICTHLGCLPGFMPKPDPTTPVTNWPGGYFCPCHGSKYDLAGRVWSGVPAPYNLPVPPYHFTNDHTVRIGQNPPGEIFELTSVVQM